MTNLNISGGVRFGSFKASKPFAKLLVSKDRFLIKGSIGGELIFKPGDISEVEKLSISPFGGDGIKVVHTVGNYADKVIFFSSYTADEMIKMIEDTQFLNPENIGDPELNDKILTQQKSGSFPIKTPFLIGYLVTVFGLISPDLFRISSRESGDIFLTGWSIATFSTILSIISLILISKKFRGFVYKPWVDIRDHYLFLVTIFCGFSMVLYVTLLMNGVL